MKLDKIRFAQLIAFISRIGATVARSDIDFIDELIDVELPQPDVAYPFNDDINELMHLMAAGTQKIEAIKVHRKLTGWGLKESKEEVEKYWKSAPYVPPKAVETGLNQFVPPKAYGIGV